MPAPGTVRRRTSVGRCKPVLPLASSDSRPLPSPLCELDAGVPTEQTRLHPSPGPSAAQVAVTLVPAPSFILFAQLASSAAFVQALAAAGQVDCERLAPGKARRFALIVLGFIGALYSNVTSLRARARARPAERAAGAALRPTRAHGRLLDAGSSVRSVLARAAYR